MLKVGRYAFNRLFLASILVSHSDAFTIFDPACTTPTESVSFVGAPSVRGTITIIWSCLSVIILCVWSIQHLCVPVYHNPKQRELESHFTEKINFFILKGKWTIITFFGPEYIFAKALAEMLAAVYSRNEFKECGKNEWHEWSTTHAYFANMRGFVLEFMTDAVQTDLTPVIPTSVARSRHAPQPRNDQTYKEQKEIDAINWQLDEIKAALKTSASEDVQETSHGNIREKLHNWLHNKHLKQPDYGPTKLIKQDTKDDLAAKRAELESYPRNPWQGYWALNASQVLYACEKGIIPGPPQTTADDIRRLSKSEMFVKLMAIVQILSLVIEIIPRAVEGIAISLLEITVLAFAAIAIVNYLLLLEKPQDVEKPEILKASKLLKIEDVIGLAARSPPSTMSVQGFWLQGVAVRTITDSVFPYSPGLPIRLPGTKHTYHLDPVISGMGIGGAIFGSIHCVAWNFDFPHPVERLLWRISCIVIIAFPPIATSTYTVIRHLAKKSSISDEKVNRYLKPLGYSIVPIYLIARLYLTIEAIRTLAFLPPSAFMTVDWSSSIPHIQ